MIYDKIMELLPELVPFLIYYIALSVRIIDSGTVFWQSFIYGENPKCEHHDIEECEAELENPLAKSHHEFVYINLSAAVILDLHIRRQLKISPGSIPSIYEFWVLMYLLASICILGWGLVVKWKGVDSLFFSMYAMSIPYAVIFTVFEFGEFTVLGFPFPMALAIGNIILVSFIMLIHEVFVYFLGNKA